MDQPLNNPETDFTSTHRLCRRFPIRIAAGMLLFVHAALLAYAATRHSPTFNEPGHLVAGISHWQFGRFELYRVNPPLSHMVAAAPVLLAKPKTDWNRFFESPGARPVFSIGEDFIAANNERSVWLFTLARWACIPFSLLGGYFCFRWATDLYGPWSGVLALTLWCFSPNILAHAELVTPDMAATSLGVTAGYVFWRWLKTPTWFWALVSGIVLGAAELTKFTWIILFGLWPLLWIYWKVASRRSPASVHRWCNQGLQLALQLLLAIYVINLGYGFEGTATKLGDFEFVSTTFKGPHPKVANRFAQTWLKEIPVPLPKNYLLGIDIQKRDFEDFGRPSYLRGEFRDRGWWYYYAYAAAVKVPLGTWILFLSATAAAVFSLIRRRRWPMSDTLVLLSPAAAVFIVVSSQAGFSHHFRYVLPCFPFLFIWISQHAGSLTRFSWQMALVIVALFWSVGSSLWYYPHNLSYFNELAGGPLGGPAHLINSNIDWGQDLLNLKQWLAEHPTARPLHLAYYGYCDPADLGIEYAAVPHQPKVAIGVQRPAALPADIEPGWYAVSVNYVQGYPRKAPRGAYSYFQKLTPTANAGYSIYIYEITGADLP